jgi:YVTN family beta-propeller protein
MLKRIYLAEGIVQGNLRSHAILARGFIELGAVLILAFSAWPAAAAPFAYVANSGSNTVSVIDTATNKVVGPPIALGTGTGPVAVAVTPDGTHAYVANGGTGTVSVIATATNTVLTGPGTGHRFM